MSLLPNNMGGALILLTVLASVLLWADLRNKYVWVVLAVMIGFGAIGWYDDWVKIVRRDPNGMKFPEGAEIEVVRP